MPQVDTRSEFDATLLCPKAPGDESGWAFVVLPLEVSAKLPRRGRTSIEGKVNGQSFTATLEPDGKKSHWLRLDADLLKQAQSHFGDTVHFEIQALEKEPDPEVPEDLLEALTACPEALETWNNITTLARVDWIHWATSAKQAKTRVKRINEACDKLRGGQKEVCCFDNSGFYSKAFKAPQAKTF